MEDCERKIRGEECDSVRVLSELWEVYKILPMGTERDYISDDIFNILASLLKVVLKSRAECGETDLNDRVGRFIN